MEAKDRIVDHGETVDLGTGEVLDRRAADGRPKIPAASSFGEFIRLLEDGQLDADLHMEMQNLAAAMVDYYTHARAKAKGKLKIEMDFAFDGVFRISTKYVVTAPKEERGASILFTTDDNRFTPHRPGQGDFFGMRDVNTGPARFRDA